MTHIVVGTAGHIDHGKSTLVQALTGIDPDRLKEEKERGITIELGFAHATIDGVTVAFVDVPGHERFVRTMLAGAGGVDGVMLIVAADESVMPQTREHFDICRLLKVQHGVVVLTKVDAVDADTVELVRLEVKDLVRESFLEDAPVVAVSARTGAGLDDLRGRLQSMAAAVVRRSAEGAVRLPVDRAFTMQGFGTVVTGTLLSGRVHVDEELALVPGDQRVRVRGIHVHGRARPDAFSGQRTAINLGGVDVADVMRGHSLVTPDSLTVTRRVDARLELLPTARALRHGARVHFHQGTLEALGRVSLAGAGASELQPGEGAMVRLRLEASAALTRGDRFIIRAYSPTVTIGGGEVLDPDPPRAGVRTAAALERFTALAGTEIAALVQMIADRGPGGVTLAELTSRAGVTPGGVADLARRLVQQGDASLVSDRLFAPSAVTSLSSKLIAAVRAFHAAQPLADGIPREEARERVFARAHPLLFEHVVGELARENTLQGRDRLSVPGHTLQLSPDEARARDLMEAEYRRAGLKPPDAAAIASAARVTGTVVEKVTALLLRQKVLARVDTLVFHAEALSALKREVQAMKAAAPGGRATVDVATFKERFDVTRKYAIPLLEWLDRERVTRRVGDTRTVL